MKQSMTEQYNILIESRLTRLETIAENQTETLKELKTMFAKLSDKIDRNFYWTMALILGSLTAPILVSVFKSLNWVH